MMNTESQGHVSETMVMAIRLSVRGYVDYLGFFGRDKSVVHPLCEIFTVFKKVPECYVV